VRVWFQRYPHGQTDTQTDILITTLRNHSCWWSKYAWINTRYNKWEWIIYGLNFWATLHNNTHTHTHTQPFYGPFSGTTRVSRCQKRTSGLDGAGEINGGRHTDHLGGRHSIRTNQCPPPPSPHIFLRATCLPAAQPTASKHWGQICTTIHSPKSTDLLQFCYMTAK